MNHFENRIETLHFKRSGMIPNHPSFPVLLYKGPILEHASRIEELFNRNNWLNSWRNGIFPYHHYHSNSHEVLGVISGYAEVRIGGEDGQDIMIQTGDVIVLPAGTGHKKLSSSADFKVAGAYPEGMNPDQYSESDPLLQETIACIQSVPIPVQDPVTGGIGPLHSHWKK
ncbi:MULTISPECIES: cupin domain-containing protein [Bacillaceae]|uniref:Cupin domain-containing protein n=1 Tax=Metabacillus sediminis TaxID=3117746 RepID=A0ABZ2NGP9_9BACI|nr:cupin domain-containing protein [Bacillus sp. SJS]KZZ82596.1 hypothetical protein AS29_020535 [Bacillus sp. SJS]